MCKGASLVAQMVKCLPTKRETQVRSLGQEDPLEKEMANHSSIVAWKIPWTEEPDRLQSMGSQRVGHDWATSLTSLTCVTESLDCAAAINIVNQLYFNKKMNFKNHFNNSPPHTLENKGICILLEFPRACAYYSLLVFELKYSWFALSQVSVSSISQSCSTLCDPKACSTPGLPVHRQLSELTQTHVHWVGDAIQPSHPLSSPSPPAFNLSQHQGLFKWVSSLHQVAKVLPFQIQN